MALSYRRKQSEANFFSFFLKEWKLMAQVALALLLFGCFESTREVFFSEAPEAGSQAAGLSPSFIFQINLLAAVSLILPAWLFILAGQCLFPKANRIVHLCTAGLFFLCYLLFTSLGTDTQTATMFHWSIDSAFRSKGQLGAAATSVMFFSIFVVCYRFVVQTRGFFFRTIRLSMLVAVVTLFTMADQWLLHSPVLEKTSRSDRLRLVLVLNDFDFSDANDFLTKDSDEKFLNSIKVFRPLMLPSSSRVGQLATLFTGKNPYQTGIRSNETSGRNWELFADSWLKSKILLETRTDFHFSNIMSPSSFFEFIPVAENESDMRTAGLCPEPSGHASEYSLLARARKSLLPFMPRWFIQNGISYSSCVPMRIPIDELIHHEMMNGLGKTPRKSNRLTSIWNLDLSKMISPLSEGDRNEADPGLPTRRNLAMIIQTLSENLRILEALDHTEIHVIGLTSSSDKMGAYFFSDPNFTRPTPWPLSDENSLTSLTTVSGILSAEGDPASLFTPNAEETTALYSESSEYQSKPELNTVVWLKRTVSCAFRSEEEDVDQVLQLDLSINSLLDAPQVSRRADPELHTWPARTERDCLLAAAARLEESVSKDVQLFEPLFKLKDDLEVVLQVPEEEETE